MPSSCTSQNLRQRRAPPFERLPIATRTTSKTVTFAKPFTLGDIDEVFPAGDYVVETDEDLLQGLSFSAYLRIATVIYLPNRPGNPRLSRALTIDPQELDASLSLDREETRSP